MLKSSSPILFRHTQVIMFAVSQIVSSPLRGKIKMGVLFGYSAAISNSPLFDSPPLAGEKVGRNSEP
jgi:hypothetical protein